MTENEISRLIVDAAYKVHTTLGPGLLESVYQISLAIELKKRGLAVQQEVTIPIVYDGQIIDQAFRADLIVNDSVIIELKSVEEIVPVHKKQLLTYLRLSNRKLGLLINFGTEVIRAGIHRVVNGLEDR